MQQVDLFSGEAERPRRRRTGATKRKRGPGRDNFPSYDDAFKALIKAYPDVWTTFHRKALEILATNPRRVSAKRVWEDTRAELKTVTLDNSYTAAAARHLVAVDPRFAPYVEMRARRRS
jgi:hypothetical protein